MNRALIVMLVAAVPSLAQIGAGIKVGAPLTEAFDTIGNPSSYDSSTKRYIIGPSFELGLPAGFAIELDALYSEFDISTPTGAVGSAITSPLDGSSWEFPLMLKKKFGRRMARPFIGAGASFRRLSGIGRIGDFITGSSSANAVDKNNRGFVIGGGVELKLLFFRLTPEIRFTRWGTEHFSEGVRNVFETNKSQGQFLVGFSF